MIKSKNTLLWAISIFFTAEIILGILLQTAGSKLSPYFSYTSVVLACLFCSAFADRSRAYLFTQIALIFTVCADFFLVITPIRQHFPGMVFFSGAQICYFLRLYADDENKTKRTYHIIIRAISSVIAIAATFTVLGSAVDKVAVISMFYYANLIINTVFAFADFKKNRIFAIGLLLFATCDAIIGLSFLEQYFALSADSIIYKIIHPGFDLAWAFYLPSQALLSVSLLPQKLKNIN